MSQIFNCNSMITEDSSLSVNFKTNAYPRRSLSQVWKEAPLSFQPVLTSSYRKTSRASWSRQLLLFPIFILDFCLEVFESGLWAEDL